jgi:hypothetical protein
MLTDFTSYDEVRLVVGLSKIELTDTDLGAELFMNHLQRSLRSVISPEPFTGNLETEFTTVKAIPVGTRTVIQQELYNLTRLYSTYLVAYQVCTALPMMPKAHSDGKRSLTRFSPEAVFKDTKKNIENQLRSIGKAIRGIGSTTEESFNLLLVVKPAVDVVTG